MQSLNIKSFGLCAATALAIFTIGAANATFAQGAPSANHPNKPDGQPTGQKEGSGADVEMEPLFGSQSEQKIDTTVGRLTVLEDNEFARIAREDNVRLAMGPAFHDYYGHISLRGRIDYHFYGHFIMSAVGDIGLAAAEPAPGKSITYNFGGLGMGLRLFSIGDFSMNIGAVAGFLLAGLENAPSKLAPGIEFGTGFKFNGSLFVLGVDASYRLTDFYIRDTALEIHEIILSPSIGFRL